jgi:Ca-activated chloride channel homolog
MSKRHRWRWVGIFVAVFLAPAFAQDGEVIDTIKVKVRLVEVYATVYDQKGRYVDGLKADNFKILEDGQLQRISIFENSAGSLSCAILLDTTGSMREALPRVKNSVVKLIDALGPQDAVAIYSFDEHLSVRQDFTIDKDAAKRAVLRVRAEGGTALFDAISVAAEESSKRRGKKAIVVFTDGDDNSSLLTASGAIGRAKKLGIPLYAIAEGEAARTPKLEKLLNELSERTGGASYRVKKPGDIDHVFESIATALQHLYVMSYKPPGDSSDGKWRKIDLLVTGIQNYHLRAKQGYFPE